MVGQSSSERLEACTRRQNRYLMKMMSRTNPSLVSRRLLSASTSFSKRRRGWNASDWDGAGHKGAGEDPVRCRHHML